MSGADPPPEMSRPFAVTRIGASARVELEANEAERQALATRMQVPAIHRLTCRFDLRRGEAGEVSADGLLQAHVRQVCVLTLEEFDADLVEPFSVRFVPAGAETEAFDLEAEDEVVFEGGTLDLGEAASEQLALALDPFPRMPGACLPEGVTEVGEGAFAGLGRLLRPN